MLLYHLVSLKFSIDSLRVFKDNTPEIFDGLATSLCQLIEGIGHHVGRVGSSPVRVWGQKWRIGFNKEQFRAHLPGGLPCGVVIFEGHHARKGCIPTVLVEDFGHCGVPRIGVKYYVFWQTIHRM